MNRKILFSLMFFTYICVPAQTIVTFTKDQIATIILPTAPDASKGKYYRLDRWEDEKIILEEEPQPQARTPYVIVPNEDFSIDLSTLDVAGLRFDTVRIEAVSPYDPTRIKEIRFVGTYSKRYIGAKDNGFHLIILDTTSDCYYQEGGLGSIFMGPLRAHFEVHIVFCRNWKPWNKLIYALHDHVTSIDETIDDNKTSNEEIYDLQGRKLSGKPSHGIYIEDGKKKVMK